MNSLPRLREDKGRRAACAGGNLVIYSYGKAEQWIVVRESWYALNKYIVYAVLGFVFFIVLDS
jgi:hypothetical protein